MKPKTVAQARRNMIKYLKNQGNYKISDFKGMYYNEIRPIFEKVWDFNQQIEPMDSKYGSEIMKSPEKMKSAEKIEEEDIATQKEMKERISCIINIFRGEGSQVLQSLREMLEDFVDSSRGIVQTSQDSHTYADREEIPSKSRDDSKMLKKKLEVDHESSQAFELLRFIRSQVQK
ncbi:hypothetical protein Tco_0300751 [Tanacetum coccineum]